MNNNNSKQAEEEEEEKKLCRVTIKHKVKQQHQVIHRISLKDGLYDQ